MTNIKLGNKVIYYQVFYKNNKHMYLRMKEDYVLITCHPSVSKAKIEAFIQKHALKILNHMEAQETKQPLYSNDTMMLFGLSYELRVIKEAAVNTYHIFDTYIEIHTRQKAFEPSMLETIYQIETIKAIETCVKEELDMIKAQFSLENITWKAQLMKSRYGSCIPKKRIIKLNSLLARLPKIYLKTILIHEIIHLKVHNHSQAFYQYIHQWIPNYKDIIKSLNQYARKVHIA